MPTLSTAVRETRQKRDNELDFYPSAPFITRALIGEGLKWDGDRMPNGERRKILEPACGNMDMVKVLKDSPFCITELVLRKWTRNICSLCSSQNVQHKLSNYALKINWNWPIHYIAREVLDKWLCWYFIPYHGTKKIFFIFVLVTWWKHTRKAICLDSLVFVLLFSTSRFLNSNSSTSSSCTSSHQNFKLKLNVYQCECHPTC